jgi:hypothetical protein
MSVTVSTRNVTGKVTKRDNYTRASANVRDARQTARLSTRLRHYARILTTGNGPQIDEARGYFGVVHRALSLVDPTARPAPPHHHDLPPEKQPLQLMAAYIMRKKGKQAIQQTFWR